MTEKEQSDNTIKKYSTAIVQAMIKKSDSLSGLKHKLTKGELRELFVCDILNHFLTSQFGVGSGIIVNGNGNQSHQTDIIIYDKRVLPPFIKESNLGVYPIESVIATLEVKSTLNKRDIVKAEKDAKLIKELFQPPNNIKSVSGEEYKKVVTEFYMRTPLCSVVGFSGNGVSCLQNNNGIEWLNNNIQNLFGICLINKFSWLKLKKYGWKPRFYDETTNEETKRFIAVLLDNILTLSQMRLEAKSGVHFDLYTAYIRN